MIVLTSGIIAVLTIICFFGAIWLFFHSSYDGLSNYWLSKLWKQAEKIYTKFELMFMEEKFTLPRCKILLLLSVVCSVVVVWLIVSNAPKSVAFSLLVLSAILGWFLPGIIVDFLHKHYVKKFDDQLLDAVSMLGGSLSAGLSLVQAIDVVADHMPQPVAQEFRLMLNEYKFGASLDESILRIVKRIPSYDLWLVMESILILRSTGANLVDTFDTIVYTLRERRKVEEKIKTMTTMGVAQAVILLCMPFVLMFILNKLNPDYMKPLFTTTLGWGMLVLMVLMLAVGAFFIKKIITIDV